MTDKFFFGARLDEKESPNLAGAWLVTRPCARGHPAPGRACGDRIRSLGAAKGWRRLSLGSRRTPSGDGPESLAADRSRSTSCPHRPACSRSGRPSPSIFEPSSPTPEPASLILLGAGVLSSYAKTTPASWRHPRLPSAARPSACSSSRSCLRGRRTRRDALSSPSTDTRRSTADPTSPDLRS